MINEEQKLRIKEMITTSLIKGPVEEINSIEYVQNRKPVNEKNSIDAVRMDTPLLTRVMELNKKDKENQVNELVKKVMTKLKV